MGQIRLTHPVNLITGFIFCNKDAYLKAKETLVRRFGDIDFESRDLDFNYTGYYQKELGKGLKRKFLSFKRLIPAQSLPKIKTITNKIESKLSENGLRLINIDPGYVDTAKLVLASTKNFRHRIYLDKGIYAEITLFFQNKSFRYWEWTFPDYRTLEYINIFNHIRKAYLGKIK